ncbi:MAG TPA: SDR family oxidoreductase [Oscillospiraceae bacterium]|nr:SDR family oxidoreductase [Oscillospiraceae bacterium]HPS33656.1 SDR family oxidoreductase [Oscillospiraceae bacterium]
MEKLPFKINLKNKIAVVTGAGGVLCSGFAKTLAACGAKVAVLDLRLEAAQKVADEITADGGIAIAVSANVLEKDSLETARKDVTEKLGVCDILINGAGGNNPKGTTDNETLSLADLDNPNIRTFFDLDPDGVSFVFNLNFIGTLLPTQAFAKDMAKKGGGIILNVSSMNAFRPLTKIPAYSAAKAAVSNFTAWLAVHFAPVGIRVNAIAPGFFVTNQNYNLLFDAEGNPTARSKKILAHTPMNRFGEQEDLTGTLLWLCDDAASGFVNGIVVPVDGGFSAYSGV